MKRLVAATLLTLTTTPTSLLFAPSANADTHTVCYPVSQTEIIQNPADHPDAYANGYSEGRQINYPLPITNHPLPITNSHSLSNWCLALCW